MQEILDIYQFPHIRYLKLSNLSKEQWKIQSKNCSEYWTEHLQSEARKNYFKYLNIDSLKIGSTHLVWSFLESTVSEVRMGITKFWMLKGKHILQTNKYKFSKTNERATCLCCGLGDENVIHMLLECPPLYAKRKQYFSNVKSIVSNCIGIGQWEETFNNKTKLVQLILDNSKLPILHHKSEYLKIARATTEICHKLHVARLHKLSV